jgi:hypothetical protein
MRPVCDSSQNSRRGDGGFGLPETVGRRVGQEGSLGAKLPPPTPKAESCAGCIRQKSRSGKQGFPSLPHTAVCKTLRLAIFSSVFILERHVTCPVYPTFFRDRDSGKSVLITVIFETGFQNQKIRCSYSSSFYSIQEYPLPMTRTPPAFPLFMLFMVLWGLLSTAGCTGVLPSGGITAGTAGIPAPDCQPGLTRCDGTCRDLALDVCNCGACGNGCPPGGTCGNGYCMLPVVSLSCRPDQIPCQGSCVSIQTHFNNCGGCSHACQAGQVCRSGGCISTGGPAFCNGTHVDTRTDIGNCGSCGHACQSSWEVCRDGECVVSQCSGGMVTDCSGTCVITMTDPFNCGSCKNRCSRDEICSGGSCKPAP